MKSMRVPSYKAVAMAILNNDLHLYALGFQPHISHWCRVLKDEKEKDCSPQSMLL